ncbi:MAG: hypothetical protein M3144_08205, partial [Actinomycetota bacterium]|nr:hypothetical protein [Actinomycetota bacterium]
MAAVRLLLRAELRSRWRSWIGMVLLVGVAGGVVLLSIAGARRTAGAYDRFVVRSSGHDAFILGAQFRLELDDVARLPEVADIAPVAYAFTIEPGGSPQALTPLVAQDEAWFTRIDRPKVLEGRRPDPGQPHEIAITPPLAESRNLRVGSTLTLLTYGHEQIGSLFGGAPAPTGPVVTLRVVGIEVSPNEGELTSSLRSGDNLHLTPAFYRTYAGRVAMGSVMAVRL